MVVSLELLFPPGPSKAAYISSNVARAHGSSRTGAIAAFCLGRSHPALFYVRKRIAHGVLQLRGLAGDFPSPGAWPCASGRNGSFLVEADPACARGSGRAA